jgi:1,4-dihydroxy-2-naphthoate polyprenyltransferase
VSAPSSSPPTLQPLPTGLSLWFAGARPRTLPAAVVPVAVGTAAAYQDGSVVWWRAVCALIVSLALQVGVNFANDYSDGVRGTDTVRVGPLRLVGSGAVPAASVKRAAYASFGVAAVAGLGLAAVTSWWLIVVGLAAILAAWTYTGGPRPYGYAGFGELFVFVFFGVVATMGSEFVHNEHLRWMTFVLSVGVGLLAMALLVVNNLRDIPGDTAAGKNTLAVRIGDGATRWLYGACVLGAFVAVVVAGVSWRLWPLLGTLVAIPAAFVPLQRVLQTRAKGRDLIAVLGDTGRLQLLFGVALTVALLVN